MQIIFNSNKLCQKIIKSGFKKSVIGKYIEITIFKNQEGYKIKNPIFFSSSFEFKELYKISLSVILL